MNKDVRWVNLTHAEIKIKLKKKGLSVTRKSVRQLLKKHNFVKRKMQRKKAIGESNIRNEQFDKIAAKKKKFMRTKNPILSIDTKKKEHLGALYRKGNVYCTKAQEVYDHDYPYLSDGKIVPHGIYDIKNNKAHISLGASNETAEFICNALKSWWNTHGKKDYSCADMILILCDAGGANSYRSNLFKIALQKLVNKINIPIKIAHYPPYTSKWNPIEHRVFPHVTRAIDGITYKTVEEMQAAIKKTQTSTGLSVTTNILKRVYAIGQKAAKNFMESMKIKFDKILGHLNYTVYPMLS